MRIIGIILNLTKYLVDWGVLRSLLYTITLVLIVLAPFSGGNLEWTVWGVTHALVAPAMFVIVVFVLPLEITMTQIFISAASVQNRVRLARVQKTTIVLFVLLLLMWTPYVYSLLSVR